MAKPAAAKLAEGHEILQSFDARDWARHFVAHVKANPAIPLDEATMTSWFATALMRGYDQHSHEAGIFVQGCERWKAGGCIHLELDAKSSEDFMRGRSRI